MSSSLLISLVILSQGIGLGLCLFSLLAAEEKYVDNFVPEFLVLFNWVVRSHASRTSESLLFCQIILIFMI